MGLRPGSKELIRDLNSSLVLNALRRFAPCSRGDLVAQTGLVRSTVSEILSDLQREGLLETVSRVSSGGRPTGLLRLAARARLFAGFALDGPMLTGLLLDLYGVPVRRLAEKLTEPVTPLALAGSIQRLLEALQAEEQVAGAGLVIEAARHGWVDVPLEHLLRTVLSVPVAVVGGPQALALAERHHGPRPGARSLAAVLIDEEIRVGLILGGELHLGAAPGTGDLSHLPATGARGRCACGRRGCLATVASLPAVLAAAGLPPGGAPANLPDGPVVDRALAVAGQALGGILAYLASLLHPELLILGGPLVRMAGPRLLEPLRHSLRRQAVPLVAQSLQVLPSSVVTDPLPTGAGIWALEAFFHPPLFESAPGRS